MITHIPLEDGRYVACAAEGGVVILARTAIPSLRILDMDFARGMVESDEDGGKGGDGIFFIVDVGYVEVRVDVVCEILVADSRHSIRDSVNFH